MDLVYSTALFVWEKLLNIFYFPGTELELQQVQAEAASAPTDLVVRYDDLNNYTIKYA